MIKQLHMINPMRQQRKLNAEYIASEALTEAIIKEVWELRLEMLKLTKSKEDDWAYFSEIVSRPESGLMLARDPNGELQGFYSLAFFPVNHMRRKAILMYSKYFYFRKAYRGHSVVFTSCFGLLPTIIKRYGLRHMYFTVSSYHQSYTFLNLSMGKAWALQEDDIPQWERHALDLFAADFFRDDWDSEKQLIANQSIPTTDVAYATDEVKRLHQNYEKLNPDWRAGYSMPLIAPFNHRTLIIAVRRLMKRLLRE